MYYHLSDHIYIAGFRDELILLNTKTDKYAVYPKIFSNLFVSLLNQTPLTKNELSSQALDFVSNSLQNNIFEKKATPYPFWFDHKLKYEGAANVEWKLPDKNKTTFNIHVLKGLYTLIKVNFFMRYKGFYKTIQLIKKSRLKQLTYYIPPEEDLYTLANTINKACLFYPTRIKCLEWAMAFVLLALARGWKCNLEIGVQNYPFIAHAWVECDGKIIMDNQELRNEMAVILNEPFRKLRT